MLVNNVKLEAVAVERAGFPQTELPEIVFAGKSNVGKSSLINAMVNRKALARASQSPGKTRTINFYNVEDLLYFVDLPGYGYARASKSESEKWGKMIEGYLLNRAEIAVCLLLVDLRHEPGENDILMYEWLKYYNHKIIVAATKSDKLSRNEIAKNGAALRKKLKMADGEPLIPFSSLNKNGRDELWAELESALGKE